MKRLVIVLGVLALGALPASASAQGGCRGYSAGCTGFQAGAGCYGARAGCTGFQAGAGCRGFQAGAGCVGARQSYGCHGQRAGCLGGGAQMGFPAGPSYAAPAVSYERYEKYEGPPLPRARTRAEIEYEWTLRAKADPELRYAPAYTGPRPFAYGTDGVPLARGEPRGDGKYATESGRPLPPGIIPWDGPVVGTLRAAAGYNRRR